MRIDPSVPERTERADRVVRREDVSTRNVAAKRGGCCAHAPRWYDGGPEIRPTCAHDHELLVQNVVSEFAEELADEKPNAVLRIAERSFEDEATCTISPLRLPIFPTFQFYGCGELVVRGEPCNDGPQGAALCAEEGEVTEHRGGYGDIAWAPTEDR